MPISSPLPDTADRDACRDLLRGGSRSFFAAALLLPARLREPAAALYAFCRVADDAVDLQGGSDAVDTLRTRLARIYAGCPMPVAADRAFAGVVARFAIPRALPDALIEGFAWDAAGRRYADIAALEAYAARVAGSVGAMMAILMGVRAAETIARACDLGVAMQLTNIARDVGEDARAGRLYLPEDWLREAGIEPARWLAAPSFDPRLAGVVRRLLARADALYARADLGISALPWSCRPGIRAARMLYAEIGREVERRGLDSVSQRATVAPLRKLGVMARALCGGAAGAVPSAPGAPEATRFLVEAAALPPLTVPPPWWQLGARAVRLLDLMERLERRQQLRRGAHP